MSDIEWKDLGTNSNKLKDPDFVRCKKLGHKYEGTILGNCYYEYRCPICKIVYRIDSSD